MASIVPLHSPTDSEKVESLAADMRQKGWVGEPVLVDDEASNEPQACTGSHRIAAAKKAEIEVETYELCDSEIDLESLYCDCFDDDERLAVIKEGNDPEAIRIMETEIANNNPASEIGSSSQASNDSLAP